LFFEKCCNAPLIPRYNPSHFRFPQKNKKLAVLRAAVGMGNDDDSSDPFAETSTIQSSNRKVSPSETPTENRPVNTPRPQAPKPPKPRVLETTDVFKKPTPTASSQKTVHPKTTTLSNPTAAETPVLETPENGTEGTPEGAAAANRPLGETNCSVHFSYQRIPFPSISLLWSTIEISKLQLKLEFVSNQQYIL
jgi:hypothetical protein